MIIDASGFSFLIQYFQGKKAQLYVPWQRKCQNIFNEKQAKDNDSFIEERQQTGQSWMTELMEQREHSAAGETQKRSRNKITAYY